MENQFSFNEHDELFFVDAIESIDHSVQLLLDAEKKSSVASIIQELFRTFHTIKGGAQMVGCEMLAVFAHQVEDLLDLVRSGVVPANTAVVDLVLDSLILMEDEIALYRQGCHPVSLSNRQSELLLRVHSMSIPGSVNPADVSLTMTPPNLSNSVRTDISSINLNDKCTYFVLIHIDESAPMPELSEMLIKQRMDEAGTLFFYRKKPDCVNRIEAILQTSLNENELKKQCDSADVKDIQVNLVVSSENIARRISLAAVDEFQNIIRNLDEMIKHEESPQKLMFGTLDKLAAWCSLHVEKSACALSRSPDWVRSLELLRVGISLWNRLNSSQEQRYLITQLLQNFWEDIYVTLENRVYFFCIYPALVTKKSGLLSECKRVLKASPAKFVAIDLSSVPVMEFDGIEALEETLTWLETSNLVPLLVAKGDFRHRHNNVIDALSMMHEGLTIYSSVYNACLDH